MGLGSPQKCGRFPLGITQRRFLKMGSREVEGGPHAWGGRDRSIITHVESIGRLSDVQGGTLLSFVFGGTNFVKKGSIFFHAYDPKI